MNKLYIFLGVFALSAIFATTTFKAPNYNVDSSEWTSYISPLGLQFEYPSSLDMTVKSEANPTAFLLSDSSDQFAIFVVLNQREGAVSDYCESMMNDCLNDVMFTSPCKEIQIGYAEGLEQEYDLQDGSETRQGRAITLVNELRTLMFDVNYPAPGSNESNYEETSKRIFESLKLGN